MFIKYLVTSFKCSNVFYIFAFLFSLLLLCFFICSRISSLESSPGSLKRKNVSRQSKSRLATAGQLGKGNVKGVCMPVDEEVYVRVDIRLEGLSLTTNIRDRHCSTPGDWPFTKRRAESANFTNMASIITWKTHQSLQNREQFNSSISQL